MRLAWLAAAVLSMGAVGASAQDVVAYHNASDRSGLYVVPGLTGSAAAKLHLDGRFKAAFSGNVYAQPLYWHSPATGKGLLIVSTESNVVYALNADTGAVVWKRSLAAPAPPGAHGCGNIDPEGITGTPVIDPGSGTLYLDAMTVTGAGRARQMLYALSANSGKVLPHWPLDIEAAMAARKAPFDSTVQGERSALQFFNGRIYVNFSGRWGDCGRYHGIVVEVTPKAVPTITGSWQTRSAGGGIWAQGGLANDGGGLLATTGNTFGPDTWQDGEAVVRLHPGLARPTSTQDYFAPADWKTLDRQDLDLGATQALPLTVPSAQGKNLPRVLALGKDGNAYLLNGFDLGGIGGALKVRHVSNSEIKTAPAIYGVKAGTLAIFTNNAGIGQNCSGNGLMALRITADKARPLSVAWCAPFDGRGSPIVTTTDGSANPVAWVVGAEGDNRLHAFNALNGRRLYTSATQMNGVRHFSTLIAANGHLYVAADNTVYGFVFPK